MARALAITATAVLLALVGVSAAVGAKTPPAATPISGQLAIKSVLGEIGAADIGVVPTIAPAHFVFVSYSVAGSPAGLNISFADRRFIKTAALARLHAISYESAYYGGAPKRCSASSEQTLRIKGDLVYVGNGSVWRCMTSGRGRILKLTAAGEATVAQLALLLVSARPIA